MINMLDNVKALYKEIKEFELVDSDLLRIISSRIFIEKWKDQITI